MKANKKTFHEEADPIELTRQLRYDFFAQFDHDLEKVCKFLMEDQEKYKDQLIDVDLLRKQGIIKK